MTASLMEKSEYFTNVKMRVVLVRVFSSNKGHIK